MVADVQYRSMRDEMEPIVYYMARSGHGSLVVRFAGRSPQSVVSGIERIWRRHAADVPFESLFVADVVSEMYNSDEARGYVFAAAALLAIVVGCLGLYALAAFTAERRTKEIGIRKVFGARTRDIMRLLVWQFSKPVVIANLIAWPVAWWVMRDWLNGFEDRIDSSPCCSSPPACWRWRSPRAHRRPRDQGRPRQPDPRTPLRMKRNRLRSIRHVA